MSGESSQSVAILMAQSGALSPVTNFVIAWNTHGMEKAV
jgi:hypothetical protein